MGVIKGNKPRAAINPSDQDELTIDEIINNENNLVGDTTDGGSETEEIPNYRQRVHRLRNRIVQRTPAIPIDHFASSARMRRSGARKLRRFENLTQLMKEREEEFGEVSIEDFFPSVNSSRAFAKLLEGSRSDMLHLLTHFLDPQEDREEIHAGTSHKSSSAVQAPEEAFNGICRNLRTWLRQRHLPLGMMERLEETLLDFFLNKPRDTFISDPLDSFQRGMLHALSQYNNLQSHSIKGNTKKKCPVRVQNDHCEFFPPSVPLVQYIEAKYHTE